LCTYLDINSFSLIKSNLNLSLFNLSLSLSLSHGAFSLKHNNRSPQQISQTLSLFLFSPPLVFPRRKKQSKKVLKITYTELEEYKTKKREFAPLGN